MVKIKQMIFSVGKFILKASFFSGKANGLCCLLLIASALTVASCTTFSLPARAPHLEAEIPESYSAGNTPIDAQQRWWETFGDEQLQSLIAEALSDNQTLLSYWARFERAQAQAWKTGADLKPSLTGEADVSRTELRNEEQSIRQEGNNYSIGLLAGYEVDLWGRIQATHKSALLAAEASREDLNAAAMTIAAEVVERWAAIISQRLQRELLEQQLHTNKTYLDLVELRFRKSLASALEVFQQRQLVERVRAQLPLIDLQERLLENQLAVLLGRLPNQKPQIMRQQLPVLTAVPEAGLPVQLLENRPDIISALHRLEAADQDLAAARADRLPAVRLTGSASYSSDELDELFDNWLANLAAALTAPLFDGSRRKAEVEINRSEVKLQLAEYRQVVLAAVREVEDALINETKTREHITALEKQLQAAQSALTEARTRYINGLNDYLPVLTQLLTVQGLENDLIRRQEDLLVARINLYRAIGGTWVDNLSPPEGNNQS